MPLSQILGLVKEATACRCFLWYTVVQMTDIYILKTTRKLEFIQKNRIYQQKNQGNHHLPIFHFLLSINPTGPLVHWKDLCLSLCVKKQSAGSHVDRVINLEKIIPNEKLWEPDIFITVSLSKSSQETLSFSDWQQLLQV